MYLDTAWIVNRAALSPKNIALIDMKTEREWSYADLVQKITGWRQSLREMGIQKGDRVAVLSSNTIDVFPILFACGMEGTIYVPLNWRLRQEEVQNIILDCMPRLLLYSTEFVDVVGTLTVPVKQKIQEPSTEGKYIQLECTELHETDPWMIIYTGGTTGTPKGAVLSYQSVNWNAINTIISWNLCEHDVTINYMPLFHTGGLNALAIPLLMIGGTVVIGDRFDPEEALRATNIYKATISLFVPTMYEAMTRTEYFNEAEFPTMEVFLSGGAPCPTPIYSTFKNKGLRFKEGYGLTEAGPNNFFIDPDKSVKKVGSIGRSMQFNAVKVVHSDGRECGPTEVGELLLRGRHLFSHYWGKPDETAETMENGWFRTGDLATYDEEGDYFIVGRMKEMIITGGENVYPLEVEQCLLTHPAVTEAAVIGVPDDTWGEAVTAFVSTVEGVVVTEEELIAHCKGIVGSFKVPKKIVFIPELPKTHVGKIDKKALLTLA